MPDDVLGLECPGCGRLYGEHTLDGLAACVEALLAVLDEECEGQLDLDWPPLRPVEVVRDPQGRVR